jgi:thioredoxin-like negative regulator of GroEL
MSRFGPRRPSRKLWLVALLLSLGAGLFAATAAHAYVSTVWLEDAAGYEDALRQQRIHHAPMLVYFRTDWCPYCRAFDQRLGNYEMKSKLEGAIKVRLNPEHGPAERKLFQEQFGAKGFPAIYWVAEGRAPKRLSAGKSVAEFLAQIPNEPRNDSPVNETLWRDMLQAERFGDSAMRDPAVVDVDRPS